MLVSCWHRILARCELRCFQKPFFNAQAYQHVFASIHLPASSRTYEETLSVELHCKASCEPADITASHALLTLGHQDVSSEPRLNTDEWTNHTRVAMNPMYERTQ
jgi:hypothetical protein